MRVAQVYTIKLPSWTVAVQRDRNTSVQCPVLQRDNGIFICIGVATVASKTTTVAADGGQKLCILDLVVLLTRL